MANQISVTWQGASQKKYTYWVYSIPTSFEEGQVGNYIYAKVVSNVWVPIYIGQGDLRDRTDIDKHHQSLCLKKKSATHVHAHVNAKEADRLAEEEDLLAGYPNSYKPTGCNEIEGG
jgi:hypothetical protein